MIKLYFQTSVGRRCNPRFFYPLIRTIFAVSNINPKSVKISLISTNDKEIQKLNFAYRNKNQPTDVLSFLYSEQDNKESVDGEIFISLEKANSQAKLYEQTLCSEMARLFAHGVLHLLGIDHEIKNQKNKFFSMQEDSLNHFWERKIKNTNCIQKI
ncbi:MAG: rRNA maturation RNase YbeY [Patescibacteria group bacterium]|nr:rRNA maturation RNase YbeY [Patescibacteria group bacterium]